MIRQVNIADAAAIAEIYNYYVTHTTVTFEEEPVSVEIMTERIQEIVEKYPWLVIEENGVVVGYAYAGPWKSRCAYRYSVEVSVYLGKESKGKGYGSLLYSRLLELLRPLKLHGIIGGIALPNDACTALHQKFGFERVAHFKEVGYKFDQWIDVVYYEKLL
jgi:phosphinothricin acetyltransferase